MRHPLFSLGLIAAIAAVLSGSFLFAQPQLDNKFLPQGVLNYSSDGGSHFLWSNGRERSNFMLKMVSELITPAPDYCIDRLHKELERETSFVPRSDVRDAIANSNSPYFMERDGLRLTQGQGGQQNYTNPANPTPEEGDSCEHALASCGNCHMPRKNNCNYEITYGDAQNPKTVIAQVVADGAQGLTVRDLNAGGTVNIKPDEIYKTVWLNGADPLVTWWNFKSFTKRGEQAQKMMKIAHENDVACTNCHLRHGDFRLTPEGEAFAKDGTVVRKVPLSQF